MSSFPRTPVGTIAAAALFGGALFAVAAPAHAADSTSGPGITFFTQGTLKPGATIDIYAECGYNKNGKAVTGASVTGFNGRTTELSPMASGGYLGGQMTVPANYTHSTAVLKLTCDNMGTGTTTVRATAAKAAPAPKPANAPVKTMPKGAPQTGGGPADSAGLSSEHLALAGVGVVGLAGAGAFALRRRAESRR